MLLVAHGMSFFGKAKTSTSKSKRDLEEFSAKYKEIIDRYLILLICFMHMYDKIYL